MKNCCMLYVLVLVLVLLKANVPQCGISALSLQVVPSLIWLALKRYVNYVNFEPKDETRDQRRNFDFLISRIDRILKSSNSPAPVTMERKRKLNQDNTPVVSVSEDVHQPPSAFGSLRIDPRLLQALVQQRFSTPTLVQSKTIPLALEGKDVLGTFFHLLSI